MELIIGTMTGWLIGLMAALPIGPVNLICIRRTLQCGWRYGFTSGLGAALGDGLFACITGFGLTYVTQLIEGYSAILQIAGGVLLVVVGMRTFLAPPPVRIAETYGPFPENVAKAYANSKNGQNAAAQNGSQSKTRGMASTFVLTMTNPATLFGFTTWFMALGGLARNPSFFAAACVVMGVVMGSATWWFLLTTSVGKLHARIDDRVVRIINQVSGMLIAFCGIGVLGHVVDVHLFR